MMEEKPGMDALVKALADSPRRDNSVYHSAMAAARHAFDEAEAALGGPVRVSMKSKRKRNGDYVVKWKFSLLEE